MRRRLTAAAAITALTLAGLTGCGGSDRWCEHDATDTRVTASYCEENTPGYEWESSSSGHSHRRKTTKSTTTKSRTGTPPKTTGSRTTSGSRSTSSRTSSGSRSGSSRSSSSSSGSRSSGSRR